jgi:predicted Zn-dependent peptidase
VLQELGQARDTPDDIIFDHLQDVIYPHQPLGWPILGDEKTVMSFTPKALRDYSARRYRAPAMTLISSGAVSHAEIVRIAEEKFAKLRTGTAGQSPGAHYVGGEIRLEQELEQVHVAYAFPGVSSGDPDFYLAQLHATVLGGGMSSRLFQELRVKRGLCYSVYAFTNNFQDGGFTGIYVGTGEDEAAEISAVIAGEMEALTAAVGDAELARAKAQLKSSLLMGLERPGSRAEQIAGQMFTFGRVQSVSEIVDQIESVDAGQLKRYAARVMANPSMAAIGPLSKLERHDVFAARFARAPEAAE